MYYLIDFYFVRQLGCLGETTVVANIAKCLTTILLQDYLYVITLFCTNFLQSTGFWVQGSAGKYIGSSPPKFRSDTQLHIIHIFF